MTARDARPDVDESEELIAEGEEVEAILAVDGISELRAYRDVTMFGSPGRPGEPQPTSHQFNVSNSHSPSLKGA